MNCSVSKEDHYGPPPAYSIDDEPLPPSYISTITDTVEVNEGRSRRETTSIDLSSKFCYYLIMTGILHLMIGSVVIFCNIRLLILSEAFCYVGFWCGLLDLLFSVYLMLFMSRVHHSGLSVRRFRLVHVVLGLVTLIALIVSSINLSKDYSYHWYRESSSIYNYKIVLVVFLTFSFLQICFSNFLAFLHLRY